MEKCGDVRQRAAGIGERNPVLGFHKVARRVRGAAQPLWVMRLAAPWLAVAGAAIVSGVFAAGQADVWLGRTPTLLLIAAVAGGTFLILFSFLGSSAVVVWPIAATVGYLVEIPRDQPVITFNRLWVGGLLAY